MKDTNKTPFWYLVSIFFKTFFSHLLFFFVIIGVWEKNEAQKKQIQRHIFAAVDGSFKKKTEFFFCFFCWLFAVVVVVFCIFTVEIVIKKKKLFRG